MAMIAFPSVQSLLIQMQFRGQPLSTGTAFVALSSKRTPYLLTNRHNVTGRNQETDQPLSKTGGIPDSIVIVHNKKNTLGQWVPRTETLYDMDGKSRWKEHPVLGAKADFVALPISALEDVALYPYDPGNPGVEMSIGPAETISVIGFPFGITAGGAFAVWATGFIASEPDIDFDGLPVQLIDCRSRQGQSGSPVLAYRAGGSYALPSGGSVMTTQPVQRLLGIYSGRINAESDLGIVWKISAIKELMDTV